MKLILTLGPGLSTEPYGDLVVLDWETKSVVDEFRYEHRFYEKSHKGLAGGSWQDGGLLIATEVEILKFDVAPLRFVKGHTSRVLNDVHHVAASADRIWICNTGLDCLEELDLDWEPLETHDLVRDFGRRPAGMARLARRSVTKSWNRFRGRYELYTHLTHRPWLPNVMKTIRPGLYHRRDIDLRVCDFRPHVLHPNHVLPMGDDVWVTLWQTGEVASLKHRRVLARDLGNPHDGIPAGDRFYVTDCLHNRLIVHHFDPETCTIGARCIDRILTEHRSEAFVRGVAVGDELIFVGMSVRRMAPPGFGSARIAALDRTTLKLVEEWTIPEKYGKQVFSLIDARCAYG